MDDERAYDVVVVGAGPGGMAAACTAARHGRRVAIVDDNVAPGGQIWRGEAEQPSAGQAEDWFRELSGSSVEFIGRTRVFGLLRPGVLLAESTRGAAKVGYDALVIATGARELFLPFPGWTLPNVMSAGGLQAMVRGGLPVTGKRVVVTGSGPLLPAVAAHLAEAQADIVFVAEQAPLSTLAGFGFRALSQSTKRRQAFQLRRSLAGIPWRTSSWPISAQGGERLEAVTLRTGNTDQTFACDYLACSFGLVPNTELAVYLGCTTTNGFVDVTPDQETSLQGVFCAGEPTGIGGVDAAIVEGQIAGHVACGQRAEGQALGREREKNRRFAQAIASSFALRRELRELTKPETIVCRCEDVTMGRLSRYDSWRAAKLQTRCGMGPCQGRVCGPAAQFLLGFGMSSVRPPVWSARVESLSDIRTPEAP